MTTVARHLVSKKKNRFIDKEHNFDLDLSYVTDRIIAMGFPASGKEAMFRNPLPEVQRFYRTFHEDNYRLYNLCAEKHYDEDKFNNNVGQYPFYDHNAPPMGTIAECCNDIHAWLEEDEEHVVGINCKAGKGRTGLIICCYLLHCGYYGDNEFSDMDSDQILAYYGDKRTSNGKGVTIASQQRYIRYYERVLHELGGEIPEAPVLSLSKVRVTHIPKGGSAFVSIELEDGICESETFLVDKKAPYIDIDVNIEVIGDCKIQLCVKKKGKRSALCHFWFNTGFIEDGRMHMEKSEIDVANKDPKCKVFQEDFQIICFFEEVKKKRRRKKSKISKKEMKESSATSDGAASGEKKRRRKKSRRNGEAEEANTEEVSGEKRRRKKSRKKKDSPGDTEDEPSSSPSSTPRKKKKDNPGRKSFYDYSDYSALQGKLSLSTSENTSEEVAKLLEASASVEVVSSAEED
eukprot:TRINITY_DN3768_c0_g1_i2.p1 TRINITY_DN3768_c0_g1~~TRINITY_DN3768_c0_g1_i2.p1  ORF type:complete len:461 (+),score=122.39 TRINITY_DN3768_c0_g1_i2:37-1419(+)